MSILHWITLHIHEFYHGSTLLKGTKLFIFAIFYHVFDGVLFDLAHGEADELRSLKIKMLCLLAHIGPSLGLQLIVGNLSSNSIQTKTYIGIKVWWL